MKATLRIDEKIDANSLRILSKCIKFNKMYKVEIKLNDNDGISQGRLLKVIDSFGTGIYLYSNNVAIQGSNPLVENLPEHLTKGYNKFKYSWSLLAIKPSHSSPEYMYNSTSLYGINYLNIELSHKRHNIGILKKS